MINHSFAVMAYHDSPYLSSCLDSLKKQTVKSEIYIATSTPSPFISEMAEKYGIKIFTSQPNRGIAYDWNFSLTQAQTRYVTLAHQDDIYTESYTELCIKAAEKFKNTLICFSDYSEIAGEKERKNTLLLKVKKLICWICMPFKKNLQSNYWKKFFLSFGSPIPCPSVIYNKELLSDFHFSDHYNINLDWDAWLQMANMKGRFVYVPKVLFKHRIHNSSTTTIGLNNNIRKNEDLEIFSRLWPKFIARLMIKLYARSYKSNKLS